MSKVQEYLEKKRIANLGLTTIWVVKSHKENGVDEPYECDILAVSEKTVTNYTVNTKNDILYRNFKIKNDKYPFEVEIENGKTSNQESGYGSGIGDLWCWTYFYSLSKEEAYSLYEKEKVRVENELLFRAIKVVSGAQPFYDTLTLFARNKYEEKFKNEKPPYNSFHYYSGFEIINSNSIKIKYKYGVGDFENDDSFTVTIQ